jgi:hypothetical protein
MSRDNFEEENAKNAKEEREKARNSDFTFSLYIFYFSPFRDFSRSFFRAFSRSLSPFR